MHTAIAAIDIFLFPIYDNSLLSVLADALGLLLVHTNETSPLEKHSLYANYMP